VLESCDPEDSIDINARSKLMLCDKRKMGEDGVTLERGGADDAILEDPDNPSTRKSGNGEKLG